MNQEPIIVKLLTQSKAIQYIAFACAIILVVWAIKAMFSKEDLSNGLKAVAGK